MVIFPLEVDEPSRDKAQRNQPSFITFIRGPRAEALDAGYEWGFVLASLPKGAHLWWPCWASPPGMGWLSVMHDAWLAGHSAHGVGRAWGGGQAGSITPHTGQPQWEYIPVQGSSQHLWAY